MQAERNAYQHALQGLSDQIAKIYREECTDDFSVEAYLIQDDTVICLQVSIADREAWIPVEIGLEGWNNFRRERMIHESTQVARKRLDLEKVTAAYVASQVGKVIDAYR